MSYPKIKILSYIGNMKKVIFACPMCRENNSLQLSETDLEDYLIQFRCSNCGRTAKRDFSKISELYLPDRKAKS